MAVKSTFSGQRPFLTVFRHFILVNPLGVAQKCVGEPQIDYGAFVLTPKKIRKKREPENFGTFWESVYGKLIKDKETLNY